MGLSFYAGGDIPAWRRTLLWSFDFPHGRTYLNWPRTGSKPESTSGWSGYVAKASAATGKQEAEPRTAFSLLIQHPRRFGSTEDVALMPY